MDNGHIANGNENEPLNISSFCILSLLIADVAKRMIALLHRYIIRVFDAGCCCALECLDVLSRKAFSQTEWAIKSSSVGWNFGETS